MKKLSFFLSFIFFVSLHSNAKVWRVNNNSGVSADFSDLPTAVTTALAGDTLLLEASSTTYGGFILKKKLTIIGPGYYFTDATPNPKTQANTNSSTVLYIQFDPGSAGSVVSGITTYGGFWISESNVTIERCYLSGTSYLGYKANSICDKDTVRQCVIVAEIYSSATTATVSNLLVYNNIISTSAPFHFAGNLANISGYFINNVIWGTGSVSCANFTFQNNVFTDANFGTYLSQNAFFNNLDGGSGLPTGNGNLLNVNLDNVFVGYSNGTGYSSDGRYQLKAGSPAIGAGSLNGATVDCGIFGGPAPYVLSGVPSIPSIYVLTVPATVPSGATGMSITISSTTVH